MKKTKENREKTKEKKRKRNQERKKKIRRKTEAEHIFNEDVGYRTTHPMSCPDF